MTSLTAPNPCINGNTGDPLRGRALLASLPEPLGRHPARGGTDASSRSSMACLLGAIAFVLASRPATTGPTQRLPGHRPLPERITEQLHSVADLWKSSRSVWPNHRAQLGVYFLLIEDQLMARPTHGFIVLGDRSRHRIENDDALRAWVLYMAGQIRAARPNASTPIPVNPKPAQCRPCSQRGNCGQARM
jgi:hypothetical protein